MLAHFAYSIILIFATTTVHLACTLLVVRWVQMIGRNESAYRLGYRASVLGGLVFIMSLAAYFESALWAIFYVIVGAFSTYSEAVYFSLVTFTTLGYGDVTLGSEWQILGGLEAANGIMMFGWTTALIVAVSNRLFFQEVVRRRES